MTATYRLQLHAGFAFDAARTIVPYLAELGITHLYLSPILQAAEGSTHGYDVVDANRVSEDLGGEAGFARLVAAVRAHGLQILLDIVPNHMSIAGTTNAWWRDVLENGSASYFAHYFDVDWTAGDDRVTLPVLGERYGRALANGVLGVIYDEHGFAIRAGEVRYPIAPESLAGIVRRAGERAQLDELCFIGDALAQLPRDTSSDARRRRHRDKAVLARRLTELGATAALAAEVAAVNADKVELDALLEAQAYRLVHWSVATSELTYRRFFDINTLVGLHIEDLDVFEARHERVIEWLRDGTIAGVRVDHIDGLRDPTAYLARLRERAPEAWIVVEKILAGDEALPPWAADGTTGYEFAERIGGLLVDPDGEAPLTKLFEDFTGVPFDPIAGRRAARREVMGDALHSELMRLVELAARACARSAATRDYTRAEITDALTEIIAGYPVYRTYISGERAALVLAPTPTPTLTAEAFAVTGLHVITSAASGDQGVAIAPRVSAQLQTVAVVEPMPRAQGSGPMPLLQSELDRERIAHAARAAVAADPDLLAFLELALAGEIGHARDLAIAAQQVTGAVVAKGDEDTASYRFVRLASRCEVGADLDAFALAPDAIHRALASASPRGLLATATHDTKRGEDTRMRIAAISERPDAWRAFVTTASKRATSYWGSTAPDRTLEYLMWQTFVGAWPITPERAIEYATKAAREARTRTTWRAPHDEFEAAMRRWITSVLADPALVTSIAAFTAELAPRARANSLAQLLVKLTAPGVPDLYQGCELADGSLVDPDNRRPVDYDLRGHAIAAADGDLGLAKLWTIRRVLHLRGERPELFAASYSAITAHGPHAERVFAFSRGAEMITVVPRVGAIDPETLFRLPVGTWRNVLVGHEHGGGTIAAAALWQDFPIALLVKQS